MGETKQVQKALIEKTQVELYKKEILYREFRMEIHNLSLIHISEPTRP